MNKLAITTLTLTFAFAGAAAALSNGSNTNTSQAAAVTTSPTGQQLASAQPSAGKKHMHKHLHQHRHAAPVTEQAATPYNEMRVGDPRIVYHEIGTSGAQNGNTILPFYDEPIRSSKPYEIRYDYAEFSS